MNDIPGAPCMEYLPTFTPKMTQFCSLNTWSIWVYYTVIVHHGQEI